MVSRTYPGLGDKAAAINEFILFEPFVTALRNLQLRFPPKSPDHLVFDIPVDALETAAFHFTRRPHFYDRLRLSIDRQRTDYPGISPAEAQDLMWKLKPWDQALRGLQFRCRPYGRDYLALAMPLEALHTLAYHFTGDEAFYAMPAHSS
ncbi:MAG: hypothetical protein JSS35_05550 [Proteobacteria bacterium]|nr:hypothetical protein [Pseudomonadota bacterium]